ncbi:MFS transporter [Paeniglutamicibacter psychrophenolicus]|uniref:MFS family permease n=1 Tax=Paeniglutamicibacter psychrophenolicus TaxID=257454 RepID=A0ABS4WB74_9MICC|nr:MFS transporter [Paeniglutamicibacter psychrophenolicus]MBP2373398.1 MFS family permease [Paeniglutamicibacter psychrophenolicus]
MSRPAKYWFPAALSLTMVGWGANQYVSLLVHYREEHGFSDVLVTSLLGVYVVGLVPALLLGGRYSDRTGRKRLAILAVALSMAASLALMFSAFGPVPLVIGRLLAGTATGLAMAAATSWVKELSQLPWDATSVPGSGARRASLLTSAGFWLGPVTGGMLVAWAPVPDILPYAVHILLCVPLLFVLVRLPETRTRQPRPVPSVARPVASGGAPAPRAGAGRKRFRAVIAPAAPWVFAAATMGFVVIPEMVPAMREERLAYTTVAVAITMGCGVLIQPLARRVDTTSNARSLLTGVAVVLLGMGTVLAAILLNSPVLGLAAAALLGCGNGLLMVGGLLELQRASGPDELGTLTGFFYTLAYAGFLAPTAVAFIAQWVSNTWIMAGTIVLCAISLGVVALNSRKHLPHALERVESRKVRRARPEATR